MISIPNNRFLLRFHCAFVATEKDVFIEQFGSTNGTWVNGQRVEEKRKRQLGDLVQLGETELTFYDLSAQTG